MIFVLLSLDKTLLMLLLVFAFIGQSLASSLMPYRMMNMNAMMISTSSTATDLSEHNGSEMMNKHCAEQMKISEQIESTISHSMDSETIHDKKTNNCCENQCNCFVNGCSTLLGLTTLSHAQAILLNTTKIPSLLSPLTSQQLTSLYRPPILA